MTLPPRPCLQVPGPWDVAWEGPENLSDYCRAVVARAAAVEQWWATCKAGNLMTAGVGGRQEGRRFSGSRVGASGQHLAASGSIWQYLVVSGSIWQYLAASGQHLAGGGWQFHEPTLSSLKTSNDALRPS